MAEKCDDGIPSLEGLEKNFVALEKKMEEDFSQLETILAKVKALSAEWEERHQRLKIEQEKVAELEPQIKLLNTKQEEVMASLQSDMTRAASQIQEGLAGRLRVEVAFLDKRVRLACQEAARSAAELEKGVHEARLALEATMSALCPQLDREGVVSEALQREQEKPPLRHHEQFLCGQDTEGPGKAKGAEAGAEGGLQGQPQEAAGGFQEEARRRASGGVGTTSSTDLLWALERHTLGPWSHQSGEQAASRSLQKCVEVFESPFRERLLQLGGG